MYKIYITFTRNIKAYKLNVQRRRNTLKCETDNFNSYPTSACGMRMWRGIGQWGPLAERPVIRNHDTGRSTGVNDVRIPSLVSARLLSSSDGTIVSLDPTPINRTGHLTPNPSYGWGLNSIVKTFE